jgi:hypothetical protein
MGSRASYGFLVKLTGQWTGTMSNADNQSRGFFASAALALLCHIYCICNHLRVNIAHDRNLEIFRPWDFSRLACYHPHMLVPA